MDGKVELVSVDVYRLRKNTACVKAVSRKVTGMKLIWAWGVEGQDIGKDQFTAMELLGSLATERKQIPRHPTRDHCIRNEQSCGYTERDELHSFLSYIC